MCTLNTLANTLLVFTVWCPFDHAPVLHRHEISLNVVL